MKKDDENYEEIYVELKYLTKKMYKQWVEDNCHTNNISCDFCLFKAVQCDFDNLDETKSWYENKNIFSESFLNQKIKIKMPKKGKYAYTIPQETIGFLKCINLKYNWIAKNQNGLIQIFTEKPTKHGSFWDDDRLGEVIQLQPEEINPNLFRFMSIEDEEPLNIKELIVYGFVENY